MNQVLYYGDIVSQVLDLPAQHQEVTISKSKITFSGFNLSASATSTMKLDLLFYNRVNENGDVLSSLVYISNPLSLTNVSDKQYDLRLLLANTTAEKLMNLNNSITDFRYLNSKYSMPSYFIASMSPLSDQPVAPISENGDLSVRLNQYGLSFDGWYTMMSVGIRPLTVGSPILGTPRKGLVGIHTFADLGPQTAILTENNPSSPYNDSNWSLYTSFLTDTVFNPDGTVYERGTSLADLISTTSLDNPHIKCNFFVLSDYLELYDQAAEQYATYQTYGNAYPTLRNKHRLIHEYARNLDLFTAQFLLQTTDYYRAIIQK
jgi:hypothetical protein